MDVLMPQLGETVAEGTIAVWHKKTGDTVEKGELLLDVETEKVATEIEAPVSGVLASIDIAEGETVDVGTVLAVIAVDGEVIEKKPAASEAVAARTVSAAPASGGLPAKESNARLSPVVRRLVKQHNLDIADIAGTGRDGRVTRQNVLDYIAQGASRTSTTVAGERIPFDRVRKATAAHMVRSKAISPHVLQTIDVDFLAVDRSRLVRKEQWKADTGFSLSYLPYVARAICKAIVDFPRVNASVDGDALIVHPEVNLAIAIDLNHEGLVAAVTRNAGSKSVSELAMSFNDLIAKAKTNKLKPDDLQGGTYTLSNPGPFGTLFTAPIINQPQVGILSMDAVKSRPHVIETAGGESIAIRPIGILAHSFDHRAVDGAYSAAYLNRLKAIIENTDWESEF
jgi:2-oxoglutarate dehydrogenase E2 component (dihydrolipoamide succinyltransferase)